MGFSLASRRIGIITLPGGMVRMSIWNCQGHLGELRTPWFRIYGERLEDDRGKLVDYWRMERADSVIVLPKQGDDLLLPLPMYRPGAKRSTWDFPGGRAGVDRPLVTSAEAVLDQELGIPGEQVEQWVLLNPEGWWVNSSFSDQKLYGFLAIVRPTYTIPPEILGARYSAYPQDEVRRQPIQGTWSDLYDRLDCLQCRCLLGHLLLNPSLGSK